MSCTTWWASPDAEGSSNVQRPTLAQTMTSHRTMTRPSSQQHMALCLTLTFPLGILNLVGLWLNFVASIKITPIFLTDASLQLCFNFHIRNFLTQWGWVKNCRHFADGIFRCISLTENFWVLNKVSLDYVPRGPIANMRALVQIMAWHLTGNKALSETMLVCCIEAYTHHMASMSLVLYQF